jgi:hypothetical protein
MRIIDKKKDYTMYAGLRERGNSLSHPVRGKTNKKVLTQLFYFSFLQPTRCVGLVKWVRAVLTQHTALLMSQPELVRSLTPLYQVFF